MTCTHRDGMTRCEAPATVWLVAPDGEWNPGGHECRPHAEAVTREYAEKLGEPWTFVPIDELGNRR